MAVTAWTRTVVKVIFVHFNAQAVSIVEPNGRLSAFKVRRFRDAADFPKALGV
jgi:hypothetical protein